MKDSERISGRMVAVLAAVNLPLVLLWLYLSRGSAVTRANVIALFLLLLVLVLTAVILPCVLVSGLLLRRWLLIVVLGFINVFWCLKWIDLYRVATPGDPLYARQRLAVGGIMLASSALIVMVYALAAVMLNRVLRRPR